MRNRDAVSQPGRSNLLPSRKRAGLKKTHSCDLVSFRRAPFSHTTMAKRKHTVLVLQGQSFRRCVPAMSIEGMAIVRPVFTLSLHRRLNNMQLLYPSLCIVGAIVLMKEQRGPSSFMGASAAVVCIPFGMCVSYHSNASRFLQEAARCRGSDGSASRGRQPPRDLWTRDLERTSRRSLTVVQARWSAFANRAARSVATWP
jgi:hypothetical protein